jgi:hypothetical protein
MNFMLHSQNKIFQNIKIAIFEPNTDFATNPTLMTLSEKLLEIGAEVDLFSHHFAGFPESGINIQRYSFPYPLRLWCYGLRRTFRNWRKFFINHAWQANSVLKRRKYDLVFGIDPEGAVAAHRFAFEKSIPFIYISFEIFFRDELLKRWERLEKNEEIIASRNADLVVIQDHWRARLLEEENTIPKENFFYLPVSPGNSKVQRSNYLRKHFNIPKNKIIVLHSGSFENWTYAEELIKSLHSWPADAVLVVHMRRNPKNKNYFINRLKKGKFQNVILSLEPLNRILYEEMVSSADIGLVLYKTVPRNKYLQKNIETIGLASGKFSVYMKYGLPVISIKQKTFAELLEMYKFGINLDRFSEMPDAMKEILDRYEIYRKGALQLFSEKLNFDIYWIPFLKRIAEIMALRHRCTHQNQMSM